MLEGMHTSRNLQSAGTCYVTGSILRSRQGVLMLHFFHAMFSPAVVQSSTWHALPQKETDRVVHLHACKGICVQGRFH